MCKYLGGSHLFVGSRCASVDVHLKTKNSYSMICYAMLGRKL